jgi:hypothetical protein
MSQVLNTVTVSSPHFKTGGSLSLEEYDRGACQNIAAAVEALVQPHLSVSGDTTTTAAANNNHNNNHNNNNNNNNNNKNTLRAGSGVSGGGVGRNNDDCNDDLVVNDDHDAGDGDNNDDGSTGDGGESGDGSEGGGGGEGNGGEGNGGAPSAQTAIPWPTLQAGLRSGLRKAKFHEEKTSKKEKILRFVQRQWPFCRVELAAADNNNTPTTAGVDAGRGGTERGQYNAAARVQASATGVSAVDMALFVALDLEISLEGAAASTDAHARQQHQQPCADFAQRLVASVTSALLHATATGAAGDEPRDGEDDSADGATDGGGDCDGGDADNYSERCKAKLPTPAELGRLIWGSGGGGTGAGGASRQDSRTRAIDTRRNLRIFTWGDKLVKAAGVAARGAQWHINAKPLNGHGGGANTRYNALQVMRVGKGREGKERKGKGGREVGRKEGGGREGKPGNVSRRLLLAVSGG